MLAVNMPALPQAIHAWPITPDLPKYSNIGKRSAGEFKTAQLKEYPPAVCAALAACTEAAMCELAQNDHESVEAHFLARCHSMISRDFGTSSHIGRDRII